MTAIANLLLVGWLSRQGGMELVGLWSLLNVVILYTLIGDFGYTSALTRHIAMRGVEAALPTIRWLLSRLALLWVILILACLGVSYHGWVGDEIMAAALLSASAGFLQVASNWLVAIRLGQHEQFWFNVKAIVRVVVQSCLAATLFSLWPQHPAVAFGLALVVGSLAEALLTLVLVRQMAVACLCDHSATRADWKSIVELGTGFALLNILQRLQVPILQSLVASLAGLQALGVFSVALRIPVVLTQSVNEAMRVLLPGLSQLNHQNDRLAILRILRDSVLFQTVIVVPVCLLFILLSDRVYRVWLGDIAPETASAARLIMIGLLLETFIVPFYWALQAYGDASRIALSTAIRLVTSVTVGVVVLWVTENSVLAFAGVFGSTSLLSTGLILIWSERRWGLLLQSLSTIPWRRVAIVYVVGAASAIIATQLATPPHTTLGLALTALLVAVPYTFSLAIVLRNTSSTSNP